MFSENQGSRKDIEGYSCQNWLAFLEEMQEDYVFTCFEDIVICLRTQNPNMQARIMNLELEW